MRTPPSAAWSRAAVVVLPDAGSPHITMTPCPPAARRCHNSGAAHGWRSERRSVTRPTTLTTSTTSDSAPAGAYEVAPPAPRDHEPREGHPLLEEQPAEQIGAAGERLGRHGLELVAATLDRHGEDQAHDRHDEQARRERHHGDDDQRA